MYFDNKTCGFLHLPLLSSSRKHIPFHDSPDNYNDSVLEDEWFHTRNNMATAYRQTPECSYGPQDALCRCRLYIEPFASATVAVAVVDTVAAAFVAAADR
jgi:hypothetical protein